MTQALSKRAPRVPWSKQDIDLAVTLRRDGVSLETIATVLGRKKGAVGDKLGVLLADEQPIGWEPPIPRGADAVHVANCMREGGFAAYTDTGNPKAALAVRLPLVYPTR